MSRCIVWEKVEDEYSLRLHRLGKKRYVLYLYQRDATFAVVREQEIRLPFGAVKARAAAEAHWELAKIRRT